MRKLQGFRHPQHRDGKLVKWQLRRDQRVVIYAIDVKEMVTTPNGPMLLASLRQLADVSNPNVDITVQVGLALVFRKNGQPDPQSPELWFYDNKFWATARDSTGTGVYYQKQHHLLYEIKIENEDGLNEMTRTGLEP